MYPLILTVSAMATLAVGADELITAMILLSMGVLAVTTAAVLIASCALFGFLRP